MQHNLDLGKATLPVMSIDNVAKALGNRKIVIGMFLDI